MFIVIFALIGPEFPFDATEKSYAIAQLLRSNSLTRFAMVAPPVV